MKKSWFIFLFFFCLLSLNNAIADTMKIGSNLLGNMARIEFSMENIGKDISLEQNGNEIFIDFGKTIYITPEILINLAPGYVKNAKLTPDLTGIHLTTTKSYKLNNLLLDRTFFLELIGTPSTNLSDIKTFSPTNDTVFNSLIAKNQEVSDLPETNVITDIKEVLSVLTPPPELNLEIDSNQNFSVFGFNWNKKIPYRVFKNQNGIDVSFDANISINDKDVLPLLNDSVKNFETKNANNSLNVFIPVPKGYEHYISEKNNQVLFVIEKKQLPVKVVKKPIKQAKKKPVVAKKTSDKPVAKKVASKKTIVSSKKEPTEKSETKIIKNVTAQQEKTEISSEIASPSPDIKKEIIASESLTDAQQESETLEIDSRIIEDNLAEEGSRSFSLSFPWSRDTAAALFEKQGYWWIVFDRKAEIDFSLLKRLGGDVVREIIQMPSNSSTIIRLIIDSRYNPTVRKEGLLWIMDIVAKETAPAINLDIEPQLKSSVGPRLFISTSGLGVVQRLTDPLYGDSFVVVPVYGLGWGIAQRREYPNLIIPKSIQGVVIEPLSADVVVKTNNSGIEISRIPGGLSLSSDSIVSIENEIDYTMEGLDKLFDLSAFEKETTEEYREALPSFLARTAVGSKDQKNYQRLNLAKFYLANGYIPEALSVLKFIEKEDYEMTQTPGYLAIRGIANVMFNRPDFVIDNLNREIFDDSDMAKVWLAAAYAQKEDFSQAQFNVFKKYTSAIRNFSYDTRAKIAILAAKTALALQDDVALETFIEMLVPEQNNSYQQAAYDYYKGMQHEMLSAFKEAGEHLESAKDSYSQLYHALGAKELAKLQFKLDMIDIDELAKQLERIRYAWRGDDIEFETMMDIVNIYMENQRYPEALRKMNEIIEFFPKHKKTPEIKKMATELFADLYMNDKSHNIEPVTAIALFNEFPKLIPDNKVGNDMVKKLADRLVSVDLLDNAIELLEKQMKSKSLFGEQRNEIGTRLALIYLLNDMPEKAIKTLDDSIFFPISATINAHRTVIRAKALANMGYVEEAVKLLNTENSPNAQRLKIDIYWAAEDWEKVSDSIKPLIEKPLIGAPISNDQAQLLVAWATAMRLSNNETGLTRLRENFISYMKNTPYFEPFSIIASPIDEVIDLKNLEIQIKAAQSFADFLSSYTDKLKDNNLSDIVK